MGGLAVMVSDTGSNKEIINNNKNGLIYKIGNIEELSNKIKYLYENRKVLENLSINGQDDAINKFTSDINCKNIYNLYVESIKKFYI